MEKTIDFYLGVSHATGQPILKADDGTTFQLTDQQGKYGFKILRNGKIDKKWNEAVTLFKAYDEVEDVLTKGNYTGSIFAVLNNGSILIWSGGQWNIYTLNSKEESDIALQMLQLKPIFGTTPEQQAAHVKKVVPENKNGTFFNWAEYLQASIASRRLPMFRAGTDNAFKDSVSNKQRADEGVTWGLWGTNYNEVALNVGAFLDLLRIPNGSSSDYPELNAKWGTLLMPKQKGVIGKVLGSTALGIVGGPIGIIVGFATGVAAVEAQKDAMRNQAKEERKTVVNTISAVKQQIAQSKTNELNSSTTELQALFEGSNLIYVGISVLLLIGLFIAHKKKLI